MLQQSRSARAEWAAHWPVVIPAMLGMSLYSMFTYSFGVFIEPLQHAFGWSRADISIGYSIYAISPVFLGPFMGALIDLIGSRKIAIAGVILSALSFGAFSLNNGSIAVWLALWGCLSLTAVLVKTTVWGAAISSLFSTSRGLALAAMLSGSAIAQSVAPVVGNWLIAGHGWRFAYQAIAAGWGGLTLVLVLACFFDARDIGQRKGATKSGIPDHDVSALPGLSVREALRSSAILRIGAANLIISLLGAGLTVHMFEVLVGTGLSRDTVGRILIVQGVTGIAGKFITGALLDRFHGSWIPFTSFAVQALGFALLLAASHSPIMALLAVIAMGYASGASLQASTYLCSRYAGLRNFGKIYGTMGSTLMLGAAIGPIIAGRVFDVTGSYQPLLMVGVPAVLIGSALMIRLGPYPRFDHPTDGVHAAA